jgi:hypothetical protein
VEAGLTVGTRHCRHALIISKRRLVMQRTFMAALILLAGMVMSASTLAQSVIYTPPVSAAEAQDIAASNGVFALRKIELDDGKWKIEGRDTAGARVEMKIDRLSGVILELQRYY